MISANYDKIEYSRIHTYPLRFKFARQTAIFSQWDYNSLIKLDPDRIKQWPANKQKCRTHFRKSSVVFNNLKKKIIRQVLTHRPNASDLKRSPVDIWINKIKRIESRVWSFVKPNLKSFGFREIASSLFFFLHSLILNEHSHECNIDRVCDSTLSSIRTNKFYF